MHSTRLTLMETFPLLKGRSCHMTIARSLDGFQSLVTGTHVEFNVLRSGDGEEKFCYGG